MLFARFVEDVWVVRIIGVMGLIGISVLPFDLGIGLKYLAVFAIWYVCAIVADEMKFNEAMEKIEKDPYRVLIKPDRKEIKVGKVGYSDEIDPLFNEEVNLDFNTEIM